MAHVNPWKKAEVKQLVDLIKNSQVVAVANVDGIPAAQMAKMRKSLRQDATIKVSKNTLLTIALKEAAKEKPGAEQLASKINGQTAVIFTNSMSPFNLYRKLEAAKTKAPARGGEVAPEDIKVTKGETPFKPGPIVGELQKVGIPAKIDAGKVVIGADKVLVKKGDRIPQDVAGALTRLEIFPLIVGMNLGGAFHDGTTYGSEALSIDYTSQIVAAHQGAINMAVFAGIAEPGTVKPLIGASYAKMLALANFLNGKDAAAVDDELKEKLASAASAAPAGGAAPAAAAAEEKEEEKGPSEEEAMAGLGALFG